MSESQTDHPKEANPDPAVAVDVDVAAVAEKEDWQIQRDQHKTSADQAFRVGGFKTAIDQYTKAISVDPQFVVLYSNRSAAFLANGETSKALRDARKCVEVDASFVKGHSRLAASLLALKRFEQAKDSYEFVLKKDAKNVAALKGVDVCQREITKRMTMEEQKRQREEHQKQMEALEKEKAAQAEENGNDDLLADFFDEVEEVVAETKEVAALAASSNAIHNDRQTLGTTQQQIDRLLQPLYEYRNLNPYFVLQLKASIATNDDISRRYKALSLLLHPDKNRSKLETEAERDRAQLAYDQVQKAKIMLLADEDRKKHIVSLVEEGMKIGKSKWKQQQQGGNKKKNNNKNGEPPPPPTETTTLESIQEKEVMRIFAQIEARRKYIEENERKFGQREQQQQDEQEDKERRERKFDKQWKNKDRVDKRVGNWRDFDAKKKRKL